MSTIPLLALVSLLVPQIRPAQVVQSQLHAVGARVIFFEPTQTERDSILRTDGIEVGELFDDFQYYGAKAGSFLKGRRIPVEFTSSQIIMIETGERTVHKFERRTLPDILGVLLTDGVQEPRLIPGVLTDEELISEFKNFFRLK